VRAEKAFALKRAKGDGRQTHLCVRVVSRLESKLFDAHLLEKYAHETCE
jgi:hypothetical protein